MSNELLLGGASLLGSGLIVGAIGWIRSNKKLAAVVPVVQNFGAEVKAVRVAKADGAISDEDAHKIADASIKFIDSIEAAGVIIMAPE